MSLAVLIDLLHILSQVVRKTELGEDSSLVKLVDGGQSLFDRSRFIWSMEIKEVDL